MRSIAARLGRAPSTISRELGRNAEAPGRYRATSAHAAAWERAARPKRRSWRRTWRCEGRLSNIWRRSTRRSGSASRLRVEFPDDPEMWVHRDDLPVAVRAVARHCAVS